MTNYLTEPVLPGSQEYENGLFLGLGDDLAPGLAAAWKAFRANPR